MGRAPVPRRGRCRGSGRGKRRPSAGSGPTWPRSKPRAAAKYANPITFKPQFCLWLATNTRPLLPEDDDAVWTRIREVPFVVQVAEPDPRVREALEDPTQHGTAILAWAVRGLDALRIDRLSAPEPVRQATAEYRREMDETAEFFEERCRFGPDLWVRAGDIREAYSSFCEENKIRELRPRDFAQKLKKRCCEPDRTHERGRHWKGIQLEA